MMNTRRDEIDAIRRIGMGSEDRRFGESDGCRAYPGYSRSNDPRRARSRPGPRREGRETEIAEQQTPQGDLVYDSAGRFINRFSR